MKDDDCSCVEKGSLGHHIKIKVIKVLCTFLFNCFSNITTKINDDGVPINALIDTGGMKNFTDASIAKSNWWRNFLLQLSSYGKHCINISHNWILSSGPEIKKGFVTWGKVLYNEEPLLQCNTWTTSISNSLVLRYHSVDPNQL